MSEAYVILEQGVEYNDETHYLAEGSKVGQNAYQDEAAAKAAARAALKHLLRGFTLYDFGEGGFLKPGVSQVLDDFMASKDCTIATTRYGGYFEGDLYEIQWSDLIQYFEARGEAWENLAPELVTVGKVIVQ